ncbi:mitochondrial [4Fe-4S] cluster transfer protein Fra3 [Schizosaccharomyces osmophilus]|uniref:Mitochondrial [4Fe-4S] cluster transfer protein Fra3 n=1 Tax=Schizosaccharomyces osmophilus TaxID=2545709 RepID=A0AAF0AZ45_9SCHI|nr:mitochondrial [4Fe-4S] cluster transfer protein Fra3 [Schizosaccharomyces osmophilus]WBW74958.1 mitochondrial [4Fe-4S] cluster transfer protein Fra3 [Schizosaccharomyces osmophilus]
MNSIRFSRWFKGPPILMSPQRVQPQRIFKRFSSTDGASDGESRIRTLLNEKLCPSSLRVIDVSGGCGSMYQIVIKSKLFQGKNTLAQHRLVNSILKEEIKGMHGLNLLTEVDKESSKDSAMSEEH